MPSLTPSPPSPLQHDVKELGPHTLACSSLYTAPDGERKYLPQHFRFASANPMVVRTRVRPATRPPPLTFLPGFLCAPQRLPPTPKPTPSLSSVTPHTRRHTAGGEGLKSVGGMSGRANSGVCVFVGGKAEGSPAT